MSAINDAAANSANLHGQLAVQERDVATLRAKFQAERAKRLAAEAGTPQETPPDVVVPPTLPNVSDLRTELKDCSDLVDALDGALTTSKAETFAVRIENTQYKGLDTVRQDTIKQLNVDIAQEIKNKGRWKTGFWATAGATVVLILLRK